MKEPRRVAVEQCLYYATNARIVFHLYSDVAWTNWIVRLQMNANEPAATIHGIAVSAWAMEA